MILSSSRNLIRRIRRNGKAALRGKRPGANTHKASQLHLEQLEDRTLLSTFQWTGADNGVGNSWNDANNWLNITAGSFVSSYPQNAGDIAQFTGTPAQTSVSLGASITVGEIDFNSASGILITASGGRHAEP